MDGSVTRRGNDKKRCPKNKFVVLCTNTRLTPLQAALRYRERWMVEDIFCTAKALLATRPIFRKYDETIPGHAFCSFLALVLRKEREDRLAAAGLGCEWADIVQDLERLSETEIEQHGKRYILRNARLRRHRAQDPRRRPAAAHSLRPAATDPAATPKAPPQTPPP